MLNFDNLHTVFFEQGKVEITQRDVEFRIFMREYESFLKAFENWIAPHA